MSEFIRKRVLRDLIDEIADLDPTSLELVGHRVIESIEGQQLVHHGINKDYKPVGYTVDSFTQDFATVGEYSTDKDYFEDHSGSKKLNVFTKIENDVEHAVKIAGKAALRRLYLVSSCEEPPSFRGKFNKTDLSIAHSDKIEFLDSRQLATRIFDLSRNNPQAADFFRYFLPDFSQNLDNYEYYGLVPTSCPHHQSEPLILNAIRTHFADGASICVLHGLSGSGKTQAAIDFVHSELPHFGNYIWISGSDWAENVPLAAIKRSRGGVPINVAGVFNSTKTLLVVDDFGRPTAANLFSELKHGFTIGSRVIVTSQIGEPNSAIHLPVPKLSTAVAFAILGEREAAANDELARFVEACRFCPLILSVTREVAKTEGVDRQELYQEILALPDIAQDLDGRSVMDRLLQRLSRQNRDALSRIAMSGCTSFDSKFLTNFIGPHARASLQRLGIVTRVETSSALTVHDLICSAVRQGAMPDGSNLSAEVVRFAEKHEGEMLPSVLRQIHFSADQLLEAHGLRDKQPLDWLTYSLLQTESGDKLGLAPGAHLEPINEQMTLPELLCTIDLKEAHSYSLPREQRTAYYTECADEYGRVAARAKSPDIRVELLHHQGKALRRSDKLELAVACFRDVLKERPHWLATYGQIAHAGMQKGATEEVRNEGEDAERYLVHKVIADMDQVPLRVSLASLGRLRSYPALRDEITKQPEWVKQLADVVTLAAVSGFQQFYEGFLAFTSLFAYHHGEHPVAIAEIFSDMLAIYPESVEKRQWPNVCEALSNTATAAATAGKTELSARLNATACVFADALSEGAKFNNYTLRLVAKTYVGAGQADKALALLEGVPNENKDHWVLYQQAKAQLADNRANDALSTAKLALELAERDSKAAERLGSYLDLLSRCYEDVGNIPIALTAARDALARTSPGKYGEQLEKRVTELEIRANVNKATR
ncbi:tetratricopeptide repeat protein [Sinorhizobium fredii]|uniref:tetratricopeptide repeat protein n=1 Tax=Rhizobium fredii TaxID=380 RepID=UPI001297B448|nr:tetratricopeptide repeat protein [Sinorhizobium fredii]MQW94515.1 tetratricopeptide repeat protein [Sinorhizobium fredii]